MIEKSYKINPVNDKRNTIFEYAICASCSFRKMQAMSEESVQNIQAYMQEKFVIDDWDSSRKLHFERCVVTGKPISELEEYNMIGQFISMLFIEKLLLFNNLRTGLSIFLDLIFLNLLELLG